MGTKHQMEVEGRTLTVSNLEKVFFPGNGFTKGEVIGFYLEMAEVILPHLRARPLTLKRYPDGVGGEHFYEKNAPVHTPSWVERFAVPRDGGTGQIKYVLCNDRATLVWVTNLGDIEKHVLLACAPALDRPTSIVFDLDPGEPAGILECGQVALHLRKLLAGLGLDCLVKVSGSKGLHLSVPLNSEVSYAMTQPFAKAVAELATQQLPDQVVSEMAKTIRRGKVLIDWSQNSDFKTTVGVYALRAKHPEPFVSMPISWAELARAVKSGNENLLQFSPAAAIKRLQRLGDLFAPVLTMEQKLPAAFTAALAAHPPVRLASWPKTRRSQSSAAPRDHSLKEYTAKRDSTRTPEPPADSSAGKPSKAGSGTGSGIHRFVIQKHEASHLHYDWRLEMEGVLRSWAVPKGPPTKPKEARLAMHVEDHPLEYADFEGTIPPGNYGAGTVMVWDRGEYQDLTGNPTAAYHQGKMHLVMRGQKLQGEWILLKDRRDPESNRWLLIKAGQALALSKKADDTSALSGRSMRAISKTNDNQWVSNREAVAPPKPRRLGKSANPEFVAPMECKAVTVLPADDQWSYEVKFDGYRALAVKRGAELTLYSRNQKPLNGRFPEVVKALSLKPGDFVLDGELVALDSAGRPSFQLLQNSRSREVPGFFYAFDLLHLDGENLLQTPFAHRRSLLEKLFADCVDPLRLSLLLRAPPGQILEAVRQLGLEGVVGKRLDAVYEPGERSGAWIKQRTNREQEFVIGGYVPGAQGFEALLVGVYAQKKLLYVAKIRNGFVPRIRAEILPALKRLETEKCPFVNLPEPTGGRWGESLTAAKMKECRWVRPKLICQVAFLEWTEAGHLRHCSFVAMRDDKKPAEVVRET